MSRLSGGLRRIALDRNSKIAFLAKLGVSLGLVIYLGQVIDWERAVRTISKADKSLLVIVPLFLLARLGFAAARWHLILADSKVSFGFGRAYTGYLVGAFYSVLLPGIMGGDVVRIGRCVGQTKCQPGTAVASVLLERICGVLALLGMTFSVHLLFPTTLSSFSFTMETPSMTTVAIVGIIFTVALIWGRRVWRRWLSPQGARGKIFGFVRSVMQTLSILRGRTLGAALLLSFLFQAVDIIATFLLSRVLGFTLPLTVFFAVVPLVYLITLLPISLGGLGVREGAFVFLLAQFGIVTSDVATLAFLIHLNRLVIGSLGGFVQLAETISSRRANRVMKNVNTAGILN